MQTESENDTALSSCPLCGGNNQCQGESGDCWCELEHFPRMVLQQLAELEATGCICYQCLQKLKSGTQAI